MKPGPRLRNLHMVGIGGSGMCALAEILLARGFRLSGSDSQESEALDRLRHLGAEIFAGHRPGQAGKADVVIRSSAVPLTNPEIAEAAGRGIPVVRRAELLGELMKGCRTLAVSGTHGKTTTTFLVASALAEAGLMPTVIAGGTPQEGGSGGVAGEGEWLVAEADEYDRSFLAMWPTSTIVTNIDADHLDCYRDLDEIVQTFDMYLKRLPFHGLAVLNADDPGVRSLPAGAGYRSVTYGFSPDADYRAVEVETGIGGSRFSVVLPRHSPVRVELKLHGLHNISNALGAFAMGCEEGLPPEAVACGLGRFAGAKRRLQRMGEVIGVTVFDDYAHHPSEVKATLKALRAMAPVGSSITAVFQPHLFSRTAQLRREFATAFLDCQRLFVASVYPAREAPIEGVDGHLVVEDALALGHTSAVFEADLSARPESTATRIVQGLSPGDLLVTIGAGDIGDFTRYLLEALKRVS